MTHQISRRQELIIHIYTMKVMMSKVMSLNLRLMMLTSMEQIVDSMILMDLTEGDSTQGQIMS